MYTNVKQTVFIRKVVRTHSKQTKGIKQGFQLIYYNYSQTPVPVRTEIYWGRRRCSRNEERNTNILFSEPIKNESRESCFLQ